MNTLYITYTGKVLLDEQGDVIPFQTDVESIRNLYLLTEDTKVIYKSGDIDETIEGKAGDIVITFYRNDFLHPVIVVKSDAWKENIEDCRIKEQERKERWALEREEQERCDAA